MLMVSSELLDDLVRLQRGSMQPAYRLTRPANRRKLVAIRCYLVPDASLIGKHVFAGFKAGSPEFILRKLQIFQKCLEIILEPFKTASKQ